MQSWNPNWCNISYVYMFIFMFMCLVQIEQMAVFSTIPLLYTRLCNMYVLVCRSEYCNICTYKWWGHLIDLYLRLMRSSDRFVLTNDDATWSTCTYKWWGHLINLYLQMMRSPDRFVLTNDEVTWSIWTNQMCDCVWLYNLYVDQSYVWLPSGRELIWTKQMAGLITIVGHS